MPHLADPVHTSLAETLQVDNVRVVRHRCGDPFEDTARRLENGDVHIQCPQRRRGLETDVAATDD